MNKTECSDLSKSPSVWSCCSWCIIEQNKQKHTKNLYRNKKSSVIQSYRNYRDSERLRGVFLWKRWCNTYANQICPGFQHFKSIKILLFLHFIPCAAFKHNRQKECKIEGDLASRPTVSLILSSSRARITCCSFALSHFPSSLEFSIIFFIMMGNPIWN